MATFSDYLRNTFFILLLLQFAPPLLKGIKKQYSNYLEPKTKVGCLTIKGAITDSSYYAHVLKKYFEDSTIKAILLTIDSPGGSAGSSETIAHEIELLKIEYPKPIITRTSDICASGAYYIAATTFIFAAPSTIIGGIGCYLANQFKLRDFIEHHNIHYNMIKAGDYKVVTDPFINTTPEQNAYLQNVVDDSYQNFIEHVAKHRPALSLKNEKKWANGKIHPGRQALYLGLIDRIGSQTDVVNKIKEMAMIEGDIEWVQPERQKGIWGLFNPPDYMSDLGEASWLDVLMNKIFTVIETRYQKIGVQQSL